MEVARVANRRRVLSEGNTLISITVDGRLGRKSPEADWFPLIRGAMLKRPISTGLLILLLMLTGSAWGQALPRDEQQFCSAFPVLREALKEAHANSTGDSLRRQRQLRQAVSGAAKDFKRSAGWKSSSQPAKGWLGDLYSITESTAWATTWALP